MYCPYYAACAERSFSWSTDMKTFVALANTDFTLKSSLSLRTGFKLSSLLAAI